VASCGDPAGDKGEEVVEVERLGQQVIELHLRGQHDPIIG